MDDRKKIGIMGGTFDPIHNAHLMLGTYAKEQFDLDEIWFMPNGNPPHKQNSQLGRTPAQYREEMVSLAIQGADGFRLEEYESNREEISYTYQTMEHFREVFPEYDFYFIIGADSLFAIQSWVLPERIFKTCTILAAFRDDKNQVDQMEAEIERLKTIYSCDIRVLVTPVEEISSSEIRKRIINHESITGFVPEKVEEYIRQHHLYETL